MSFIIFSVERIYRDYKANERAVIAVMGLLSANQVNYKTVDGCYGNTQEVSFLVQATHEKLVSDICKLYDQDCYLKVDNNRNACLVFPNGEETSVGLFQNVAKSVAESLPNYTKDGSNYWVASKELYPKPSFKSGV